MKKMMILFAKGFPYGMSEPFLENEYPFYKDFFDKVLIVTGAKRNDNPTRNISDPTIEIIQDFTLDKDFRSVIVSIFLVLCDVMFYREIIYLLKQKKLNSSRFIQMLKISICGNHRAFLARKWIKNHPDYQVHVIYSYWLSIPAYSSLRLVKMGKMYNTFTVSRAHGYDLYEERMKTNYIPFQKQIVEKIKQVAVISENGKKYLENKYRTSNIVIRRLGAVDYNITNPEVSRKTLRIVSCSRVIPLKRVHLIVDALMYIQGVNIEWTHIGGGETLDKIKEKALNLPENIRANFIGAVPNKKIYDIYATIPFHIFINVSESEGVPVSIMEAMSFSIPIIATSVGGTSELVNDNENGFLLEKNFRVSQLMELILRFQKMSEEEYKKFRLNSRKKYKDQFDARINYKNFIKDITERGEVYEENRYNYDS